MNEDQFDEAFDQGEYEQEYSEYLSNHGGVNSTSITAMAERFEQYEDFRDSIVYAAQ